MNVYLYNLFSFELVRVDISSAELVEKGEAGSKVVIKGGMMKVVELGTAIDGTKIVEEVERQFKATVRDHRVKIA